MDHRKSLLKLSRIVEKMKKSTRPKGQCINLFFYGDTSKLDKKQIEEIEAIVDKDYEITKAFLKQAKEA